MISEILLWDINSFLALLIMITEILPCDINFFLAHAVYNSNKEKEYIIHVRMG